MQKQCVRGISLVEVMSMAVILALVSAAFAYSSLGAINMTRQSKEYSSAARLARQWLEQIENTRFDDIKTVYTGMVLPLVTFYSPTGNSAKNITIPGVGTANANAVEIIVLDDESKTTASLGRDLSPADGIADGVRFVTLPMDFNGDGDVLDSVVGADTTRYLVGVVIRWEGPHGEERYEAWTVISKF